MYGVSVGLIVAVCAVVFAFLRLDGRLLVRAWDRVWKQMEEHDG